MLEEFEHKKRKALKSYERFKEVTLKQLDFIQSLEFENCYQMRSSSSRLSTNTCTVVFAV